MTARASITELQRFSDALARFVSSLPTDQERQELTINLRELESLLRDAGNRLSMLPVREEFSELEQSLTRLSSVLEKAKGNESLASSLGLKGHPARTRPRTAPGISSSHVKSFLTKIDGLTIDEVNNELDSDEFTIRELKAIAASMGIKVADRESKAATARRIASHVGNMRGYRSLSGSREPKSERAPASSSTDRTRTD